jgi:hypothetical protein
LALPLLSPSYSASFPFGRPEEPLKDKDKDKDRDKEREKRALLSDSELNAIRRNASHLLELHEDLHSMLIDAVRLSGWVPGLNALEFSDDYEVDPPSTDCDDGEEHFETALISVATLFTAQVSQCFVFFCAVFEKFRVCLCAFSSGSVSKRLADAYNSL